LGELEADCAPIVGEHAEVALQLARQWATAPFEAVFRLRQSLQSAHSSRAARFRVAPIQHVVARNRCKKSSCICDEEICLAHGGKLRLRQKQSEANTLLAVTHMNVLLRRRISARCPQPLLI
jgi:hypothetical protein